VPLLSFYQPKTKDTETTALANGPVVIWTPRLMICHAFITWRTSYLSDMVNETTDNCIEFLVRRIETYQRTQHNFCITPWHRSFFQQLIFVQQHFEMAHHLVCKSPPLNPVLHRFSPLHISTLYCIIL